MKLSLLPQMKFCDMCRSVYDSASVSRYKCKSCGKTYKLCLFCILKKVKCSCGGELESAFRWFDLLPF